MIVFATACLLQCYLTAEAFRTIRVCAVDNQEGICMPENDCFFLKFATNNCGQDICCLNSGIAEKKCAELQPQSLEDKCNTNTTQYRIIGGIRAEQGDFPYMVAIGKEPETPEDIKWFCGGSIVSEQYVLTAAHCLQRRYTFSYMVLAGTAKLDYANAQLRYAKEILMHPKYTPWKSGYDLALIKVEQPFNITSDVMPVCILRESIAFKIAKGVATGFGLEIEGAQNRAGNLMKVKLNLFSPKECESFYPGMVKYGGPKPSLTCAGYKRGGKDTCQGDSGGPLAIPLSTPACRYGLVGITSAGASCGLPNSPGIYIKVSYFLSWIERNVWKEEMNIIVRAFNDFFAYYKKYRQTGI